MIVNCRISPDLKECTLHLWELDWDLELITESLCISWASMYCWQNIFAELHSVTCPKSGLIGRPQIIVHAVITAIKEVYNTKADAYLDELVWWLAIHHDIAISWSALHENLQDAGLTCKLLHKNAQEHDEEAQHEYWDVIHDHSAGWGKEFVFVDEMSKNNHDTAWRYGLAISGEHAEFIDNFVHGDRYSMVTGITTDGYVSTHVIPGSFNTQEFCNYITEQVVGIKSYLIHILNLTSSLNSFLKWICTLATKASL